MILEPKPTFSELIKVRFKELECKTNTIPIMMHHMRISTTNVSSVMLKPKNLEILYIMNVKIPPDPKSPKKNEFYMEWFQMPNFNINSAL
jgi:hypothetical protein